MVDAQQKASAFNDYITERKTTPATRETLKKNEELLVPPDYGARRNFGLTQLEQFERCFRAFRESGLNGIIDLHGA